MKDLEMMEYPSYKQLARIYSEYFSLGNLSGDINEKFALISLIGYIVQKLKAKKPDVTYYQVTYNLAKDTGLDEPTIYRLAIMVEDFSYGCTNFPTFGLTDKNMVPKIKELMRKFVPF